MKRIYAILLSLWVATGWLCPNIARAAAPVSQPEIRAAAPMGDQVIDVAGTIDITAAGTPISPNIYGAAMGDRKLAAEMGITNLRAGGNEVTAINWKTGFFSKGEDWFFQNYGSATPPAKNWLIQFFGENKQAGLETYLTIPIMGRVAKDGSSVAFDIRKFPDQTSWVGKVQPGADRSFAGNGVQYLRGPDGKILKDDKGHDRTRDIEIDPDDTSIAMSPEEQTDILRFMIHDMGYGPADKGGIKYIALDNEPGLWHRTHRGMHPKGIGYDELWDRTRDSATLLKKIDPSVKIAGPAAWGWTEYFYSGLDSQLCSEGKGNWAHPPDYAAHGNVPLIKWWLTQLHNHEKQTGQRLVDILDFHFYPQTGIYEAGATNDPKSLESRVQETRVMWDPNWKDPSWMGSETNHVIRAIPLMKQWIDECNPGMLLSLGEYNFGGERDISGGIAEVELLGIFGRQGLDFAFYWLFPPVNSPIYFAFKMFRNPDGKHTAFGDRSLPVTCDHADDISIHAARDSASGRLTFIVVNKRGAKGAKLHLTLNAAAPGQDVVVYELSNVNRQAIGQLPARKIAGKTIDMDVPPMSVLRFDLHQ